MHPSAKFKSNWDVLELKSVSKSGAGTAARTAHRRCGCLVWRGWNKAEQKSETEKERDFSSLCHNTFYKSRLRKCPVDIPEENTRSSPRAETKSIREMIRQSLMTFWENGLMGNAVVRKKSLTSLPHASKSQMWFEMDFYKENIAFFCCPILSSICCQFSQKHQFQWAVTFSLNIWRCQLCSITLTCPQMLHFS